MRQKLLIICSIFSLIAISSCAPAQITVRPNSEKPATIVSPEPDALGSTAPCVGPSQIIDLDRQTQNISNWKTWPGDSTYLVGSHTFRIFLTADSVQLDVSRGETGDTPMANYGASRAENGYLIQISFGTTDEKNFIVAGTLLLLDCGDQQLLYSEDLTTRRITIPIPEETPIIPEGRSG